ncbi:hypothetical protein D9M71_736180 [compost metagenome]
MAIDHQVQGCAVEKRPRVFDFTATAAFKHADVGIVSNVFGCLPISQTSTKETHQFAIVVFQHST